MKLKSFITKGLQITGRGISYSVKQGKKNLEYSITDGRIFMEGSPALNVAQELGLMEEEGEWNYNIKQHVKKDMIPGIKAMKKDLIASAVVPVAATKFTFKDNDVQLSRILVDENGTFLSNRGNIYQLIKRIADFNNAICNPKKNTYYIKDKSGFVCWMGNLSSSLQHAIKETFVKSLKKGHKK